ncbi:MAG: hypothetical protein Q7T33_11505 [Dehalococcoidia bacterium]|nr:hypothetical protein [Dehalococcoidia bacterium]
MVRERRARHSRPQRAKASIWDTPHLKEILSQPAGAPIELSQEEARAILQHHLDNPRPYDPEKAERDLRELRKIRRESGALLERPAPDADD